MTCRFSIDFHPKSLFSLNVFNPIQVRGGQKDPSLNSFSPLTSANERISPQNFCRTGVKFQVLA